MRWSLYVTAVLFFTSTSVAHCQTVLSPGARITTTVKAKPGTYKLTDPGTGMLQITGKGFTVDLRGAKIVGPGGNKGIGIHITDAQKVTIRGANVSGCLWGVVLERCSGVTLVDCNISHNGDLPPGTVIDESGREPEDQHGGGIVLRDCLDCQFRRCTSQHQWDGIDVVRSNGNVIEDGDYSYNNNWGIHLWSASKNTFRRNRAIWCTTGAGTLYQALTGWQTYDAQAVGIDHSSCDNLIEANDLRFGGDAVFIRANEGGATPGTQVPPLHSSDRNILRGNDCSWSPNNAIEVDFVEGTIIEDNNCSNSHYGMWLGYSRGSIVRRNTCLNDTAHAVEIENGQNAVFEENLFGFDEVRPRNPLVYLRQNGNDKTPSGPYTIRRNTFYGTGMGVQLRNTEATLSDNLMLWTGAGAGELVHQETPSRATETGTKYTVDGPKLQAPILPSQIRAGSLVQVKGIPAASAPIAIEIDGIPVWVTRATGGTATFWMPEDFWDRPGPNSVELRIYADWRWTKAAKVKIEWRDPKTTNTLRVTSIRPNPARIGNQIEVERPDRIDVRKGNRGSESPIEDLPTELLLNNQVVGALEYSSFGVTDVFQVPTGILVSTKFNLIVRSRNDPDRSSWPITFAVDVPRESQPHLLSATFEPQTLHVGELLTVTMTVRNNLPVAASLVTFPKPGHIYDEKQAGWEIGVKEPQGTLHLRVSSDHPGPNHPGSWPWFFGFDKESMAAGETVTVTGQIRVETPGEHEFRVGLVASGFRFIDDNAFRTRITVLPK